MPTLKEFVDGVLNENNIVADSEQIIKMITDIARQRAVDGCAAISDDEVRDMVINNADLANKLAEEEKAMREAEEQKRLEQEAQKAAEKEEKKIQKKLEKERKRAEGEQTALFL